MPRNRISPPLVAPVVIIRSPFRTVAPPNVIVPPLLATSVVFAVVEILPSKLIALAVRVIAPPAASRPFADNAPALIVPAVDARLIAPADAEAAAASPLAVTVPVVIAPEARIVMDPPLE